MGQPAPIDGLAGFGAYLGAMRAALSLAGLDDHHAELLSLSVSIIAKATDYSLGGLGPGSKTRQIIGR